MGWVAVCGADSGEGAGGCPRDQCKADLEAAHRTLRQQQESHRDAAKDRPGPHWWGGGSMVRCRPRPIPCPPPPQHSRDSIAHLPFHPMPIPSLAVILVYFYDLSP